MNRSLLLALLALVLHALQAAAAVSLGVSGLPMVPAVVLVAYAALAEPPVEAAVSATFLGLVLDALSGSPLGLNILACLLALFVGRLSAGMVAGPFGASAFAFAAVLSAGYHLFVLFLLTVFGAPRGGLGIGSVLWTGFVDGLLAVVLMPMVQWLFVRLGLEEREVTLKERLRSRATRGGGRKFWWSW